jgi:hypothetical protein
MRRANPSDALLPHRPGAIPVPDEPVREIDLSDQPTVALIYGVFAALMEMLGPMFWAALIVLFIQAELFTN